MSPSSYIAPGGYFRGEILMAFLTSRGDMFELTAVCIFRLKAASDSGLIRPLLGRARNAKRRWITTPKWVMIPLFKGGSNGPNGVIHTKDQRSLAIESRGLSCRAIARSCLVGKETVREFLGRAAEAGLTWPLPEGLSEEALESRPFHLGPDTSRKEAGAEPDWALIHSELRKKGATRELLWEEYRLGVPRGYGYSQCCDRYRRWTKILNPVLRMPHKAGEKMFVDYAGVTAPYTNRETGDAREAQVFVATLGASSSTFAEAQASQEFLNWIDTKRSNNAENRDFASAHGMLTCFTPCVGHSTRGTRA